MVTIDIEAERIETLTTKTRPDYSDIMRCYVVGIPVIAEFNGHGDLAIDTVIASNPMQAVKDYLTREAPLHSEAIIKYLRREYGDIARFAARAESHDILNRNPQANTKFPERLDSQNRNLAKYLSEVTRRDKGDIEIELEKLLR